MRSGRFATIKALLSRARRYARLATQKLLSFSFVPQRFSALTGCIVLTDSTVSSAWHHIDTHGSQRKNSYHFLLSHKGSPPSRDVSFSRTAPYLPPGTTSIRTTRSTKSFYHFLLSHKGSPPSRDVYFLRTAPLLPPNTTMIHVARGQYSYLLLASLQGPSAPRFDCSLRTAP